MSSREPGKHIVWSESDLLFLKENFHLMSNRELASTLGLRITSVRMKCYELGLRRFEMEYWTQEQIDLLRKVYKTMGDVEIAILFEEKWPKKKRWIKQHICKKRKYLKLHRTKQQQEKIISKNASKGGRSFTIDRNTASRNLPDGYVLNTIAWRDGELKDELLKYPELIKLKREQIILNRTIKNARKNKKESTGPDREDGHVQQEKH